MNWEQLLSLKRKGDKQKRIRAEQDPTRSGFEVDYDRIIFSAAFRNLQDKTQVIPFSKTDFVHTRLTHSLEVSVVGQELGADGRTAFTWKISRAGSTTRLYHKRLWCHCGCSFTGTRYWQSPFGHSGEQAIGDYFAMALARNKNQLTPTNTKTSPILRATPMDLKF
jgi:dGTPase